MVDWFINILEDNDVADSGDDLFVSLEPDKSDVVVLYPTSGSLDPASNAYQYDTPGIQVNVIGSYAYAKAKLDEIHRLVAGNDFVLIQTNPGFVEVNEKGRRVFTASYIRSETNTGGTRIAI